MRYWTVFSGCVGLLVTICSGQVATSRAPNPSFSKDVAPLFYRKCATCHRLGQIASFPLVTFEDVRSKLGEIARAVASGSMPPWKPVQGYGEFRESRALTADEVRLIESWIAIGAPEGSPTELPPPPQSTNAWALGQPDLILQMPTSFEVKNPHSDLFQCFVIPIPLDKDQFIAGFEFHPGNPKLLHHSIFFLDSHGIARAKTGSKDGYSCFGGPGFSPSGALGGWSPGSTAALLGDQVGKLVRRGTDLVMQNHYHGGTSPGIDRSEIGLYFSRTIPKYQSVSIPVLKHDIDISAGEENYRIQTFLDAPVSLRILGVTPHMHYLGHDIKLYAALPDSSVKPLVWINDWDVRWQGEYRYREPVTVPKGSRIFMEATYDNSANNRHNPSSPPKRVRWGDDSTDEMALCIIEVAVESPDELMLLRQAVLRQPGLQSSDEDP